MEVKIDNIKTEGHISNTTFDNYKVRLSRIQEVVKTLTKSPQTLEWIMTHPMEVIKAIIRHLSKNPTTISNHITVICKLFTTHPQFKEQHDEHYITYRRYIMHYKKEESAAYDENKFTEKQKDNLVNWNEVKRKYCSMEKDPDIMKDPKTNMEFLLLSIMMNIKPKRADLGNVEIYQHDPKSTEDNYIYFHPAPTLVLNRYKSNNHTVYWDGTKEVNKNRGEIREPLPPNLAAIIKRSQLAFPRQYLFVSTRTKEPYTRNNSYTQFVRRAFDKHFGRSMGVSLWRTVYISANVNFQTMNYRELREVAHLIGHTPEQALKTYKKLDNTQTKLRPKAEQGKAVQCAK